MSSPWQPQFLFVACQHGAEGALKNDVARRHPALRFSFSRPGFVTFKLPERDATLPAETPAAQSLPNYGALSAFARTWGYSLGRVSGEQASHLAAEAWQLPDVQTFLSEHKPVDVHAWQRDATTPGRGGFKPGSTLIAEEVRRQLCRTAPLEELRALAETEQGTAPRNRWVLDVTLVEPNQWWIGCHLANTRAACWPGGAPKLELPERAVSRAYLKMSEALEWSTLPLANGETCVELGCAPGGAAQRLLEAGVNVIGIDPAEVAPEVLEHERFRHIRKRASEVRRSEFSHVQWLASDLNATPQYTLDAVEAIVTYPQTSIRGMILTLKLTDWKLADDLPAVVERVRSWGYRDVRLRQLAFNGQEICLVGLKSRSQRRVRRATGRDVKKFRIDAEHASTPQPHAEPKGGN